MDKGESPVMATDIVRATDGGCGACAWCVGTEGDECPHGYACCRNCPTCGRPSMAIVGHDEIDWSD